MTYKDVVRSEVLSQMEAGSSDEGELGTSAAFGSKSRFAYDKEQEANRRAFLDDVGSSSSDDDEDGGGMLTVKSEQFATESDEELGRAIHEEYEKMEGGERSP